MFSSLHWPLVIGALLIVSCSNDEASSTQQNKADIPKTAVVSIEEDETENVTDKTSDDINSSKTETINPRNQTEFQKLYRLIVYGQANLKQVYTALKTEDVGELVNVIHALYSMRWHRAVNGLLYDLWENKTENHPDLPWEQLQKTPVRIALASTINRSQVFDAQEYKQFIREHKYDDHEFNRAQTVVALGLNGDPKDVEYLFEMADGDNAYVSQSAITSLAIMNHERARDSLIKLANKHKDTQRGQLIIEVLKKAYDVVPTDDPSKAIQTG